MEETGVTLTLPRIMAPRMRMTLILITCFVKDYTIDICSSRAHSSLMCLCIMYCL
jgi:hypothetical protein